MKRLIMGRSYCENSYDYSMLNQVAECFNTINSMLLVKVFGNQASFLIIDGSIHIMFNSKCPFSTDNIYGRLKEIRVQVC